MANKPHLIFPVPQTYIPAKRGGGPGSTHFPPPSQQKDRIEPKLNHLQEAFDSQKIDVSQDTLGLIPEKVLVLETIGDPQNFFSAVKNSQLEWMFGWQEETISPDEQFYDKGDPEKPLNGRLFLTMANQEGLNQLKNLWDQWIDNPNTSFPRGLNGWKNLFKQLKEIRFWDTEDRLRETGILEHIQEKISLDQEIITFEIELWFRNSLEDRQKHQERIENLLYELGGALITSKTIQEIVYHGILAQIPIDQAEEFLREGRESIKLLAADEIMLFRPVGQCEFTPEPQSEISPASPSLEEEPESGQPIIGLLDGLPLSGHNWLQGRTLIEDPDEWEEEYPAKDRQHGTAMASLIIHGDAQENSPPLSSPLYIRPILKPDPKDFNHIRREHIPENSLPIDLIHRAVKRIKEGEGDEPPTAPEIKVINLSIGDKSRVFSGHLSSLARLIDWLSVKFKILFVVSSGNHFEKIKIPLSESQFLSLTGSEKENAIFKSFQENSKFRKLISPAESINALTVGSYNGDYGGDYSIPHTNCFNPFLSMYLPSPFSAIGWGYRRSVKPEILAPGGRVIFREPFTTTNEETEIEPVNFSAPPGNLVATPGASGGSTSEQKYTRGTSNAAAQVTRKAGAIWEGVLSNISTQTDQPIRDDHYPPLLKSFLIHSSSWEKLTDKVEEKFEFPKYVQKKEWVSRFIGYGIPDWEKSLNSEDNFRVTLFGWGDISADTSKIFSFPIPDSLSGNSVKRRLTLTLSWLSPTNPKHQSYRKALLWFTFPEEGKPQNLIKASRRDTYWRMAQRGTSQHEIFEGETATAFGTEDTVDIQVTCKRDAGGPLGEIPFGLVASLEVAEPLANPIYQEVQEKIMPKVPVHGTPG